MRNGGKNKCVTYIIILLSIYIYIYILEMGIDYFFNLD